MYFPDLRDLLDEQSRTQFLVRFTILIGYNQVFSAQLMTPVFATCRNAKRAVRVVIGTEPRGVPGPSCAADILQAERLQRSDQR